MKAIIVAEGPGTRLMPFTEDKPKCMLEVGGKTILQTILEASREKGINDIVVVKGYKKDVIDYPKIRYYYNPNYMKSNILTSLFCAEREMKDGFVFSYSDILYDASIVRKLLQSKEDISIVVDTDWAPEYVESMWLMLQQEEPDDYVIATGESHSVKELVEIAFDIVGLDYQRYVKVDKRFFRPLDVPRLTGDYSKAQKKLGWKPKTKCNKLVEIMVKEEVSRWKRWLNGERFPWDAPNYPSENRILTRALRM